MSDTILRVGILGQGRSGHDIHVRWLRQDTSRFRIVAVADQMPERCREAGEELGAKTYGDYRELLHAPELDLDLIVNALPSFLHPCATVEALETGRHVISEKPAARTVADFDRVCAAARAAGRLFLPFQNSRFYPYFAKMREVIASGRLGRIVTVRSNWSGFGRRWDWQTRQEYWGGNLLNTGPHPVDHAVVLLEGRTPRVFCRMVSDNPFGDAENHCSLVLYGEDMPTIEVQISSFQAYPQGDTYNVLGTRGGLTGGAGGLKWRYFDPGTAPDHMFRGEWSDRRQYCHEKLDWTEETWSMDPREDLFQVLSQRFYANAYDVLVNGADRVIQLDEVRRQVAIMEECHRQNPLPLAGETFLAQSASHADRPA